MIKVKKNLSFKVSGLLRKLAHLHFCQFLVQLVCKYIPKDSTNPYMYVQCAMKVQNVHTSDIWLYNDSVRK